ncbi:MAG: flagellar basal body P-ring protein FlgI [Pirellulales bacterium]
MKPTQPGASLVRFACGLWFAVVASLSGGCSQDSINLQSPEDDFDLLESNVKLVGDYAVADGIQPVVIKGVALVTQLDGTGSDPTDTDYRRMMISEMQTRGVERPNQVLASPDTAMVMVTAYLRPGIRKGDHFDVLVESLVDDNTANLRGGWLMETRLKPMFRTPDEVIRGGETLALTEGWLIVDPRADEKDDPNALRRARVLGGGVATKSRELNLTIRSSHKSIGLSADIGKAINTRFVVYNQGVQEGVANPKTDGYIELAVHPRYKDNLARYIAVIRSIPVREGVVARASRMRLLERQLLDPITSARAALQLEAIGSKGVDILHKGLASGDQEIRFYSAEALAYLDDKAAATPLAEIAHEQPAFRAYALTALSAMKDVGAYEQLRKLLDVSSAETRYGAFRALWTWDPQDPLVRGEGMGDKFSYHLLDTDGPPMIHVTGSFRPEIVLFGRHHQLITPIKLQAGKAIDVVGDGDQLTVSKYLPGRPIERRQISNDVDALIRAVAELGGDYGGVVQMLSEAKTKKALTSRLEVDALPRTDRAYHRHPTTVADDDFANSTTDAGSTHNDEHDNAKHERPARRRSVASPTPELFEAAGEEEISPRKPAKTSSEGDADEESE